MAGRPTKLTPETRAKILDAIAAGNYRQVAAVCAGVSAKTLRMWMQRGREKPASIFGQFRAAVLVAEQAAHIRMVAILTEAAKKDPKYALEWLERKFVKFWGKKDRHEQQLIKDRLARIEAQLNAQREETAG
jgi:hypothetical protein